MSTKTVLVVEMDQIELACRILEAFMEHKRPAGLTAAEALAVLKQDDRAATMAAALAAMEYIKECTNLASAVQ